MKSLRAFCPVQAMRVVSAVTVLLLLLSAVPMPVSTAERAPVTWSASSTGLPNSATYYGVTFGDINKDGKPDIVGASEGSGVRVYTGDGTGSWSAVANQPVTTGGFSDVRVGDLDNDGNPDIVAGAPGYPTSTPLGIHIYKGNGAGGFNEITAGSGLPTASYWRGIALGDVNKDGNLDIAATNGYGTSLGVHVYTGDGTGKFRDNSSGLPASGDYPTGIVLADFSRDGNLDLAFGGYNGASCYRGNGGTGGTMTWTASSVGLPTTNVYTGINATDFNNDGSPDIVVSSYPNSVGIRAYRNVNNAASWTDASTGLPSSGNYLDVASGDFDGDGNADLVAGGIMGVTGIRAYYGNGAGSWTEGSTGLPSTGEYGGVEAGDFNNDGSPDIVIGSATSGGGGGSGILAYRNPGAQPSMFLTSPNGGVSWSGGSQHQITWNTGNGTKPYNISLKYSTDGGVTYPNTIAAQIPQLNPGPNSFTWDVPAINSATVRVKAEVTDGKSLTASKFSTANIEIDSGRPTVSSTVPSNGAADVSASTIVRIRFSEGMNRTASQGSVTISGPGSPALTSASWSANDLTFQSSGLRLDASYTVSVSTAAKDDSDPGNPLSDPYSFTFNTSLAPVPLLTLGTPAGGETWISGTVQNILWEATGGTGTLTVSLAYSTQGANGPWTSIATGEENDGQYEWTVPNTPSANAYLKMTVSDSNSPPKNATAVTPAQFIIRAPPVPTSINITSPNGGEVWVAGMKQNITWRAAGGTGALGITLQYSTAGPGGPWTDIITNRTNDGTYYWTVPETASTESLVRAVVKDSDIPPQTATDASDSTFTIRAPPVPVSVLLISPNGGEAWTIATRRNIRWAASGGTGALAVSLDYSTAGETGPWTSIATGEANDGIYYWTVPNSPSENAWVRVTAGDADTPPMRGSDTSNGSFIINATFTDTQPPVVQINAPAEGATVNGVTAVQVTATDNVRVTKVEVFVDGVSVGLMTAAPFNVSWNTKLHTAGRHTVTARAWDAAGNAGNATPVTVTVKNAVPTVGGQSPIGAYLWLIVAVIAVVAVAGVGAVLMMRRKGGGAAASLPQAPPQPPMYQQPSEPQYQPPQPQYPPQQYPAQQYPQEQYQPQQPGQSGGQQGQPPGY